MKTLVLAALLSVLAVPTFAQEAMVWVVETPKDGEAVLAFGFPGGSNAPVVFRCTPETGQVHVTASLTRPPPSGARAMPASVTVASGPVAATLRGQVTSAVTGGALASAEFSTRAAVVNAFRKTGSVSVASIGETVSPPPAAKGMIRKFFRACD